MDKVIEERENVQNVFKDLRFYIDNFKPITQIDVEHRGKMIEFLNQAYECHLKVNTQEDNEVNTIPLDHSLTRYLFDPAKSVDFLIIKFFKIQLTNVPENRPRL